MTPARTKKELEKVWNDDMFWFQCAERFGISNDRSPDDIDSKARDQAASNFWGMLLHGVRP